MEALVQIDEFRGLPMPLVKRAIEAKRQDERNQKKGRGRARDQVWCVFDRDEHPDVEPAMRLAGEHGIRTVLSNPCLELWFLLHFRDQNSYIHRDEAQRLARKHLGCGKSLNESALAALDAGYDDAVRRAQGLADKHVRDGSWAHENPSTNIWELIEVIKGTGV